MRRVEGAAERLWRLLAGSGRVRLRHEAVLKLWYDDDASGSRAGSPEATDRLIDLLADLEADGRLRCSTRRTHRGLPAQITLLDLPPRPARPAPHGWRPELSWLAGNEPREPLRSRLRRINDWLRDRPDDLPVVPAAERSLEIFGGDGEPEAEKFLDDLLRKTLGGEPGWVRLASLRVEIVSPPFARKRLRPGSNVLVAENKATYHSLAQLAGERSDAPVDVVGFGQGNHFLKSVTSADSGVTRIHYFGDLDARGLRIPPAAAAAAAGLRTLDVVPAGPLYRALLARGRSAPARDKPRSTDEARDLAAWLPPDVREPATRLLAAGDRLAQEWVGYQVLRELDSWVDT
ncbi:MAG: hypothetical protein GEU81_06815 [Nitriliruptorales bacterium]|nr:hypothetical protein [Nitriliruptorales bacterium]